MIIDIVASRIANAFRLGGSLKTQTSITELNEGLPELTINFLKENWKSIKDELEESVEYKVRLEDDFTTISRISEINIQSLPREENIVRMVANRIRNLFDQGSSEADIDLIKSGQPYLTELTIEDIKRLWPQIKAELAASLEAQFDFRNNTISKVTLAKRTSQTLRKMIFPNK